MKNSYDIILRPIITEQSMEHADILKYSFEVAPEATKPEIKKAVEEVFGVKVGKVTTQSVRGKEKTQGRYPAGMTKAWKKAIVRLAPGSKAIEFFEGMV